MIKEQRKELADEFRRMADNIESGALQVTAFEQVNGSQPMGGRHGIEAQVPNGVMDFHMTFYSKAKDKTIGWKGQ